MLFVSMCLDECGQIDAIGGFSFNTDYTVNKVRQHPDAYFVSVYDARPGDVVIYNWDGGGTDHVGFVEKNLGGGTLQTIEGNTSSGDYGSQSAGNGVWRRVRNHSIAYVIRPAYSDSEEASAPSGPADIRALQRAVRANPDNVAGPNTRSRCYALAAASNWGGNTFPFGVAFTQSVVGTEQDGIWGPASEEAHDDTVEAVQSAVGSEVDGIYGPDTNTRVNALLDRAEQP
jgi:endolysin|nr:MAG TPA: CHAP domain protein [Caudoviricetes sp.]